MNRIEIPITRTDFQQRGIRVPASFCGDGGSQSGNALIDTGTDTSALSSTMAHAIEAESLFESQRVQLPNGAEPCLPLHGPITVTVGGPGTSITIRFSSIPVGKGDWDLLIGRDILVDHLGVTWDPFRKLAILTPLSVANIDLGRRSPC